METRNVVELPGKHRRGGAGVVEDTLSSDSDPPICNTTIAAATGCCFYDKIPFVELSGREAGSYPAKMALRESLQRAQ